MYRVCYGIIVHWCSVEQYSLYIFIKFEYPQTVKIIVPLLSNFRQSDFANGVYAFSSIQRDVFVPRYCTSITFVDIYISTCSYRSTKLLLLQAIKSSFAYIHSIFSDPTLIFSNQFKRFWDRLPARFVPRGVELTPPVTIPRPVFTQQLHERPWRHYCHWI